MHCWRMPTSVHHAPEACLHSHGSPESSRIAHAGLVACKLLDESCIVQCSLGARVKSLFRDPNTK
ncbi:hypothetical protein GUITHDRAFT_153452 [Guillardia theta CCMP2712]|uniref:Uncharacterized protein n=1 Tax=Guillardia theta (strain CCMP2712) TaxID=905079 RepID=L1J2U2_GUITC|nr:hypothetical protein GUITHDRAFT_153452 [Guillardia theta CCMP2712]EKX42838.1 hypothetical protein GUITHDRAFT_153452 [Guillardia theta CCMP2712]|eukprot:XP_005829818.1 hypothetical protein GUITHDRAFT_153452 [Guillardia theta CCMP2712]